MPSENLPIPVSLAARRASAAAIVSEHTGLSILTASLLVDVMDVCTAGILGAVGLNSIEIRHVAATVWGEP